MSASPSAQVDQSYDLYARMVCRALGVPSALVSFVEGDRLLLPGAVGLPPALEVVRETPLIDSLCQFVVGEGQPVLIEDVEAVELGHLNDIEADLGIRAYAGWPLTDHRGQVIGSLCALDTVPRAWTSAEIRALADVASACSAEIAQRELRRLALAEEAEARERAERGQLLLSLSEALMDTTTLVDIAVAVDQLAARHLGCRRAVLWLLEDDPRDCSADTAGCLRLVETAGYPGGVSPTYRELAVDEDNPVGHTFLRAGAAFYPDPVAQVQDFPAVLATEIFGHARAFLPLRLVDRKLGVLALGWPGTRAHDAAERATIAALSSYTAQAVHRATLLHERVHTSLTLQRAMLTELPSPPGLELTARYRPASETDQVGGDWYDALVLPGGGTEVACGDVVGHDIVAAAAMGQVRSALRSFAWAVDDGPAHTVTQLDRALKGLGIDALATLVCARIDTTDDPALPWCVTWTSAGHPTPLLLGPDGAVRDLVPTHQDLLLGVLPEEPRHDEQVGVAAGSTLLLFTDGLVERRGESLDEGMARLRGELVDRQDLALDDLIDRLLGDMLPEDLDDDVALLAVRFGAL